MGTDHLHIQVSIASPPLSSVQGLILNRVSVAAGTGGVIGPQYASSKSALHGLVHWLSLRYCKEGIVSAARFTAVWHDD